MSGPKHKVLESISKCYHASLTGRERPKPHKAQSWDCLPQGRSSVHKRAPKNLVGSPLPIRWSITIELSPLPASASSTFAFLAFALVGVVVVLAGFLGRCAIVASATSVRSLITFIDGPSACGSRPTFLGFLLASLHLPCHCADLVPELSIVRLAACRLRTAAGGCRRWASPLPLVLPSADVTDDVVGGPFGHANLLGEVMDCACPRADQELHRSSSSLVFAGNEIEDML